MVKWRLCEINKHVQILPADSEAATPAVQINWIGPEFYLVSDVSAMETEHNRCGAYKALADLATLGHDEMIDKVAALEARCREQLEALREGAEYLHAFTPAGTPGVDAFIAKWSDRTAPETGGNDQCG